MRTALTAAVCSILAQAGMVSVDEPLLSLSFDDAELPASATEGARLVEGRTGHAILAGPDAPCALVLPTTGHVDLARGTVAFWFRPAQVLMPLPPREETNLLVFDTGRHWPGNPQKTAAKIWNCFLAQPGSVRLRGETFNAAGGYYGTLLEYRRLYPRWYHFAWTYDRATGVLNQYLNARLEQQVRLDPWTPQEVSGQLLVGNPHVALDDIRVYGRALSATEIAALAGLEPGAGLTDEGVVHFEGTVDLAPLRGEKVWEEAFDDAAALDDWVLEGPGGVSVRDGRLFLQANQDKHLVYWNKRDLPGDLLIEYDFTPASDEGLCILFFCAAGSEGRDLFDPALAKRDGVFPQYTHGDIVCYHVSYYRNQATETGLCNLRKDPGMPLLGVGADAIPPRPGGTHRIAMYKKGDRLRFFIDGRQIIDTTDEAEHFGPALGAGKLGLRQMKPTEAYYDNLVVYRAR